MPVQPATRRLLTEAAAGTAVTTPTTPLGAALDGRFVPLSSRGAVNGVPTLGADGKIPAAQLPVQAAVTLATKPSGTARASTITQSADPHLTVTVGPGVYTVSLGLVVTSPVGWGVQLTHPTTVPGHLFWTGYSVTAPGVTQTATNGGTLAVLNLSAISATAPQALQATGQLYVPTTVTTATFAVSWGPQSSNATATTVLTGSFLRLERMGTA